LASIGGGFVTETAEDLSGIVQLGTVGILRGVLPEEDQVGVVHHLAKADEDVEDVGVIVEDRASVHVSVELGLRLREEAMRKKDKGGWTFKGRPNSGARERTVCCTCV
jgi:hypothetical protein